MKIKSEKFPNISYEAGEEIWLDTEDSVLPFILDVSEELTDNEEAMAAVADRLDNIDMMKSKAHEYLEAVLNDEDSEEYETVKNFLDFHREELYEEDLCALFNTDDAMSLTDEQMVEFLEVDRLGTMLDDDSEQQIFVIDFCFNHDFTDELMVVYFDLENKILMVDHES